MDEPNRWKCPEAITHGPPDGAGKCPFCRRKITAARKYVAGSVETSGRSELAEAYGYHYDPDEGSKGAVELERELRSGVIWY